MTEVFKRLLHWLKSVGTSVIILTATLPDKTRKELLRAYSEQDYLVNNIPFPRISIATPEGIEVIQAGEQSVRTIKMND
jgi:CRISPR-associated endonuclease/helicase Cas3